MAKKLFVAGLAYSVTDEQLSELFSKAGTVESAKVIMDHDTGRSKGFGFVEMSSASEAEAAITQFNETSFEDRTIMVKEARPKTDRPQNGSYNNDNNGRRNNGGGGRRW